MTIQETIAWFNQQFENSKAWYERKSNFYCGITNDLERRMNEHNVSQYFHVTCDSFETAKQVESLLYQEGFDTGGQLGNGQEDTVYVYMYRKIAGLTIE